MAKVVLLDLEAIAISHQWPAPPVAWLRLWRFFGDSLEILQGASFCKVRHRITFMTHRWRCKACWPVYGCLWGINWINQLSPHHELRCNVLQCSAMYCNVTVEICWNWGSGCSAMAWWCSPGAPGCCVGATSFRSAARLKLIGSGLESNCRMYKL